MDCEHCPYEDTEKCDTCEVKHPEIKHSRCPKCGGPNLKVMVTLRVSLPAGYQYNITKAKLRMKEVQIEAAIHTTDRIYCEDCGYHIYTKINQN